VLLTRPKLAGANFVEHSQLEPMGFDIAEPRRADVVDFSQPLMRLCQLREFRNLPLILGWCKGSHHNSSIVPEEGLVSRLMPTGS
jgi:hypothetical protein